MKQTNNGIKILSDGFMFTKNAFLDIHTDLPQKERNTELIDKTPYDREQESFNSAETENRLRRDMYTPLCYDLESLGVHYKTRQFLTQKYREIDSLCDYLIHVLDMAKLINDRLMTIEEDREKLICEDPYKMAVGFTQKLFEIFCEIRIYIGDLTGNTNNVNVRRLYDELMYSFYIKTVPVPFPESLIPVVQGIFPEACFNILKDGDEEEFIKLEGHLELLLKEFRDNLMEQFSYFITPKEFLNNPAGKTVFVVDMGTYTKFNFRNSGLFESESRKASRTSLGYRAYKNYGRFIKDLTSYITLASKGAKKALDECLLRTDSSELEKFIEAYEKCYEKKTGYSIRLLKVAIENPRVHEAFNTLLCERRNWMIKEIKNGRNVWEEEYERARQEDIDAICFLHMVHKRYTEETKFSSAACQKLFALFSASTAPNQRCYEHIRSFSKKKELEYPESFKKNYIPLMYR